MAAKALDSIINKEKWALEGAITVTFTALREFDAYQWVIRNVIK